MAGFGFVLSLTEFLVCLLLLTPERVAGFGLVWFLKGFLVCLLLLTPERVAGFGLVLFLTEEKSGLWQDRGLLEYLRGGYSRRSNSNKLGPLRGAVD